MINNQSRESTKIFDSLIDPEKAEELQRTKTDIETNITKILQLIKNENQSKKDGSPRRSRKEAELVGLTEDLNKQYQSLYALYDNVIGKVASRQRNKKALMASSDSDEEYFSSEEVDGIKRRSDKEQHNVSDTVIQEPDRGDNREVKDPNQNVGNTNEVLKTEASESDKQLTSLMEEMRRLSKDKNNLEFQIESQANEVKQLSIKNTELHNHVTELESLLKEKEGVVSNLEVKLNNSEEQAQSNIESQANEVKQLSIKNTELHNRVTELESLLKEKEGVVSNLEVKLNNSEEQAKSNIESQENEVKQLSIKNTELHNHVTELESLLKEKQGVVSNLEVKLNNSEEQAKSNIVKLMAQINELVLETKSLRTQKDEMEEKIKCDENEASTQREDLMEKLNVMQQKLDSMGNQNEELEAQMERKGEEISQYLTQIENLKENLAEMKSTEQTMIEEKEGFFGRLKDMELELENQSNQKNELEEQLRDTSYEVKHLMNENKALQDRNHELKAAMTQRGEEISDYLRENDSNENGASMEIMALKAEVNDMRLELDNLNEQKTKLELQSERNQKEYAESLAKIENLNTKLETQIADQEQTIKDQASAVDQVNAELKQTIMTSNKLRLSQRSAERKVEELAEKLRKKMEDNIRLLHQRIHVAEQLNNENKNSCKLIKLRYEQENNILGQKVAIYEEELRRLKEGPSEVKTSPSVDLNGFEFEAALNGLDEAAAKVEEHRECIMSNVSKMLCEVQFAKDWIKKMNGEMKQLKDNVDYLRTLLSEKEEQELLLRDKVWNLEATVSKEGGEKLNLTKAVNKLEKKVGKLEKNLKEKDEDLDSLGEKKREAIRQLCLVVEFHRDRCNYLMNLVTSMRLNKKT
ncbi:uncharacterized protein [Cicer arietinum]|uniref:COP1-interactive protein 1-like n=1 Tax=Cicer arietinum TaxID=3827 RepID=A0A3Q7Y1N6_CICAR|nr:COP1-interactive protein 1-like [Cicer arietinum]